MRANTPKPPVLAEVVYNPGLDLLRFFAAILILVWHYQNFFLGSTNLDYYKDNLPLIGLLEPMYTHGFLAVQFFWVISGFVLSLNYFESGSSKKTFFKNRFARLYPLHLITLIAVAILQTFSSILNYKDVIYSNNDINHFLLNLFFIPALGFETGQSFNGPVWSVSVELVAYLLFALGINQTTHHFLIPSFLLCLTFVITSLTGDESNPIVDCLFFFYVGVLTHLLSRKLGTFKVLLISSVQITIFISIKEFGAGYIPNVIGQRAVELYSYSLLFSPIILFMTIRPLGRYMEKERAHKIFRFLGDLTYSSYLWHIPIQIALIVGFKSVNANIFKIAINPGFFTIYIMIILIVSRYSYIHIEKPLRIAVRKL